MNESFRLFAVVKGTNKIRFGLMAIKGLGEEIAEAIYRERKQNGPYKDLADFAARAAGKSFNRRTLESLIKTGALDAFGDRNHLYFNIESILEYQRRRREEASSGQFSLFQASRGARETTPLILKPAPKASPQEVLAWEKELLGLYVSAHPFRSFAERLTGHVTSIAELPSKTKEKSVRTAGFFTQAKKILTKNGEPMVFTKLADTTGEIEAVIFPRIYKDKPELWTPDRAVFLTGRIQEKDGEPKLLVETGYELTEDNIDQVLEQLAPNSQQQTAHNQQVETEVQPSKDLGPASTTAAGIKQEIRKRQSVTLHVRAQLPETILHKLRHVLDLHPGPYAVYFAVDNAGGQQKILSSYRITLDELVTKELEGVLGRDTVRVDT